MIPAVMADDGLVKLSIVDLGTMHAAATVELTPDEAFELAKGLLIKAMITASAAMHDD